MKTTSIIAASFATVTIAVSVATSHQASAASGYDTSNGGTDAEWWASNWSGYISSYLNASCPNNPSDPTDNSEGCAPGDSAAYGFTCYSTSGACGTSRSPGQLTQVPFSDWGYRMDVAACFIQVNCANGDVPSSFNYTDYSTGGNCYAQCNSGPAYTFDVQVGVGLAYESD
jgi:hypothetical protein